jgi:predicted RNA-binding protein (TIGR00451 family)
VEPEQAPNGALAEVGPLLLAAPPRSAVYNHDGVPVLFDASGKGDRYVPTVMALWRAPELLPRVQLKHPAVSQFIVGAAHGRHGHGADVMLPGVNTEGLPPFRKGDLVAVVVPGNPAPIAVGVATLSAEDARAAGRAAGKGKAVEVLQVGQLRRDSLLERSGLQLCHLLCANIPCAATLRCLASAPDRPPLHPRGAPSIRRTATTSMPRCRAGRCQTRASWRRQLGPCLGLPMAAAATMGPRAGLQRVRPMRTPQQLQMQMTAAWWRAQRVQRRLSTPPWIWSPCLRRPCCRPCTRA